jgi:hypothetical protein
MRFLTVQEQQTLHHALRDSLHIVEQVMLEEEKFAHWTDGEVAIEARESFNGSIAVQFLPFPVPPEHWVDFKHNRDDRS